jgi:hypothetical protein
MRKVATLFVCIILHPPWEHFPILLVEVITVWFVTNAIKLISPLLIRFFFFFWQSFV